MIELDYVIVLSQGLLFLELWVIAQIELYLQIKKKE